MATETALEVCLFCERPLGQENFAVPSMPVCKYCMQGNPKPGNTIGILVPLHVLWRRLAVILPGTVIGFIVGCIVSLAAFVHPSSLDTTSPRIVLFEVLSVALGGLLGMILFTLLWEIIFFSRLQHAGNIQWKSHLIEALNLDNVVQRTQAASSLVVLCLRRPRWWDLTLPMQIGVLLEITQGLIFCSTQGTRAIFPFLGISTIGTERLKMFPPRMAIQLDLNITDGLPSIKGQAAPKQVFFAFMDEKSFKANDEKAKTKEQHIQHILDDSRKPENKI